VTMTEQTPNARYGSISMRIWTASYGLVLVAASAGLWFFAARANQSRHRAENGPGILKSAR
jgi:hypothetical protein